jgi:SAM-dependent methyltransferase
VLARNLLGRVAMHDDYLERVRERLAAGELLDAAFDQLLPTAARSKSMLHWTPLGVARLAATRLAEHGARSVLDAGSGPGKFCVVGASTHPRLAFVGVEQRFRLVAAARELAARLRLGNARFELGDALGRSWATFDGFYFFNPFAENSLGAHDVFDAARGAAQRFRTEAVRVAWRLREARRGSVLVTYHGLGGPIPSSYDLALEEESGSGCLRTWVKARDYEEDWVYLDYGTVSRVSWCASTLDSRLRQRRSAYAAAGDVSLKRSAADLQLGGGSDGAAALGLQGGLDDLAG